ncbi:GNAT family N-acetyltransferase [Mycolicibacterium mageritense]|uniref:GNAT family N-acetyltransferase n=1 Tax=Mycolicibacterium mageritense TaxID=53462 RepID=UPI001E40CEC1|nr:GNAT family N-acetyltransferase [Mycolicibacterium mageritense]GJJ22378.1 hypothetical protein MTY414_60510 [Mycolicibacterium mageritense]
MKVDTVTIQDATADEINDVEYWYGLAGASSGSTMGRELAAARTDGLLGAALRGGTMRAKSLDRYHTMFDSVVARTLVLSARCNAQTVGLLMLGPNPRLLQLGPHYYDLNIRVLLGLAKLHCIAVAPDHRNKGTGSRLLGTATNIARLSAFGELYGEFNARHVCLESFYKQRGFTVLEPYEGLNVTTAIGSLMYIQPADGDRLFTTTLAEPATAPDPAAAETPSLRGAWSDHGVTKPACGDDTSANQALRYNRIGTIRRCPSVTEGSPTRLAP